MNIQDKIAKLLALSESPVEAEAKAALLKARELMAKHRLDMSDIQINKTERIESVVSRYTASTERNVWMFNLARVIADNYCCRACRKHLNKHAKTYGLSFTGFESDARVCNEVFTYATEFVESVADKIRDDLRGSMHWRDIERYVNNYAAGFVDGLHLAFMEQNNKDEVGLVLVVPQEVNDFLDNKGVRAVNINVSTFANARAKAYEAQGKADGLAWRNRKRIESAVS